MKSGFLPLSQESCIIGEISYHDYFGILIDPEERELIARNLGPVNKVCRPSVFTSVCSFVRFVIAVSIR